MLAEKDGKGGKDNKGNKGSKDNNGSNGNINEGSGNVNGNGNETTNNIDNSVYTSNEVNNVDNSRHTSINNSKNTTNNKGNRNGGTTNNQNSIDDNSDENSEYSVNVWITYISQFVPLFLSREVTPRTAWYDRFFSHSCSIIWSAAVLSSVKHLLCFWLREALAYIVRSSRFQQKIVLSCIAYFDLGGTRPFSMSSKWCWNLFQEFITENFACMLKFTLNLQCLVVIFGFQSYASAANELQKLVCAGFGLINHKLRWRGGRWVWRRRPASQRIRGN